MGTSLGPIGSIGPSFYQLPPCSPDMCKRLDAYPNCECPGFDGQPASSGDTRACYTKYCQDPWCGGTFSASELPLRTLCFSPVAVFSDVCWIFGHAIWATGLKNGLSILAFHYGLKALVSETGYGTPRQTGYGTTSVGCRGTGPPRSGAGVGVDMLRANAY